MGALLVSGVVIADARSDPLSLAFAFALGFICCFFVILIWGRSVAKASAQKPEDKLEWWQKGEPPPWETSRDDEK